MSTLTKKQILSRLQGEQCARLVVTPLLSEKQVGACSIDVRLGNQFIIFRTQTLSEYDASKAEGRRLRQMQERFIIDFGKSFTLHPGTLVLGSTFEYLSMPKDLECQVEGRSSWARVGLMIATATSVEPGFKGVITLEISNVGTIPLKLMPGIRIAQLVFRDADPALDSEYGSGRKYQCPIGPQFSRLHEDKDFNMFDRFD